MNQQSLNLLPRRPLALTLTLTFPPALAVRTLIELVAKVPGAGKVRALHPKPKMLDASLSPFPPHIQICCLHGVGVCTPRKSASLKVLSHEAVADSAVPGHSGVVSPGEAFLPPPSHPGQACRHVQHFPYSPHTKILSFRRRQPEGSLSCFFAPSTLFRALFSMCALFPILRPLSYAAPPSPASDG